MKMVRVTSNIKSPTGEPWTYELGFLTLLIGPNESGKSAIAEAVQLAVSGSAYGLFFRNKGVKNGAQLRDLGPADAETIFAEVEFENGTTSRWEMAPGKRPKRTGREFVCPIPALREALSGTPQKARSFFAKHLLPEMSREELEKLLKDPVYDLSIPLEVLIPDDGGLISGEQLALAASEASSWKRKAKAEHKAALSLLKSLNSGPVDRNDILQAWEQLFTALKFEWLKKQFLDASGDEKLFERTTLQNLARTLGRKEDLKALEGSAQYAEQLEHLLRREAVYGASGRARTEVARTQKAIAEFDTLAEKLDFALTVLLKDALRFYVKYVNHFLPKGDKFDIIHNEKHFKICLRRGDQVHTALSGSTEARTLAAMGTALSNIDAKPVLVILDDRMWDTETLSKTMEKLEKGPGQVILMSTTSPRGRKRSAWKYVEVSRAEREEETPEELPETVSPGTDEDSIFA